jgi:hypothetical protein
MFRQMADARSKKRKEAAARKRARVEKAAQRASASRDAKKARWMAGIHDKAGKRPRHTYPDYEELLCEAERRGWLVFRGEGYFKCWCPCAEKHLNTVVLTPSSHRTLMNTRARFQGFDCWKED